MLKCCFKENNNRKGLFQERSHSVIIDRQKGYIDRATDEILKIWQKSDIITSI